jgi:hypothetical protein
MAGGMGRRSDPERGETLAQRVENTRARQEGRRPQPVVPAVKHAWYDGPHGRQAALLLGWRNIQGRYDGRIAVAVEDGDGWAIVEMWVDGAMLSPAGS